MYLLYCNSIVDDDTVRVMEEVEEITCRWKQFALVLGMKPASLDVIKSKCLGKLMYTNGRT